MIEQPLTAFSTERFPEREKTKINKIGRIAFGGRMGRIIKISFYLLSCLTILLSSCSSNSLEDFRDEGRHTTRALIAELKNIQTHQDFASHHLKLKKLFLEQIQIIDRMHQWRHQHPQAKTPELIALDLQLSEKLEKELTRITKIEGGKKFLQKCQQEALHIITNQNPKRPLKARANVPPST